ncbi:hypothetical protein ROBYS_04630 [Roseobacter sp. OBYS 0001]|nr:hypothetical protein ROBYS_04630 [Roseobacter sp. OBYS 0001]
MIVKFDERGLGEKHAGCNVEIQLRTQLQHVWGTTVEAAGAMRNEDLKAGEGSAEWLRFLTLMSGHIAEVEKQPRGDHLSMSYKDLKAEAKQLSDSLNVRQNLSTFSSFMHEAERYGGFHSSRYMLKMDASTGNVDVRPAWREMFAFDDLEDDFEETKQSLEVSVDNMEALRQAYPNYFADTREFLKVLDDLEGPRHPPSKKAIDNLDLSFLPKDIKPLNKKKVLHLEYTGKVFWGEELVGHWEKGVYGTYFFESVTEGYIDFESPSLDRFKEDIKDWHEAK